MTPSKNTISNEKKKKNMIKLETVTWEKCSAHTIWVKHRKAEMLQCCYWCMKYTVFAALTENNYMYILYVFSCIGARLVIRCFSFLCLSFEAVPVLFFILPRRALLSFLLKVTNHLNVIERCKTPMAGIFCTWITAEMNHPNATTHQDMITSLSAAELQQSVAVCDPRLNCIEKVLHHSYRGWVRKKSTTDI